MTKTILIADDQPGIRMLLKDILTDEGYHIVECETGQEAMTEIRQHSFCLVILDYKLPVMDGIEVMKMLKAEGFDTPAILITGIAEEIPKEESDLPNVRDIMAKPFNIEHILDTVNNIVTEKSI